MTDPGTRSFRITSTFLLVTLVFGTLALVGVVSFEWLRRQGNETQALVADVHRDLMRAERAREIAERIGLRSRTLQVRRLRLSILLETCVVLRLQGQAPPRCAEVREKAHELVKLIREFRQRLRLVATSDGGGRSPPTGEQTTVTRTRVVTTPRGCPTPVPNNPNC